MQMMGEHLEELKAAVGDSPVYTAADSASTSIDTAAIHGTLRTDLYGSTLEGRLLEIAINVCPSRDKLKKYTAPLRTIPLAPFEPKVADN